MSIVETALEKARRRLAQQESASKAAARPGLDETQRIQRADTEVPVLPAPERAAPRAPVGRRSIRLDRGALREAGVLPPVESERRLADEYRRIKRPLVARALDTTDPANARARLIMVGSAVPGEGKTFTSLNLALSMALERDLHVLLVDADAPKPQLSRLLGLETERGFLDLLRDNTLDVESLILSTDVEGLTVLPAGSRSDTDTELLASKRMERVMAQLLADDRHRVVILDSPPLLLTNESRELTSAAGQVVLVVRAESTSPQTVLEALDLVAEGRPVGLVLNQVAPGFGRHHYYGYGYGYGDYGAEPGRDDPPAVRGGGRLPPPR